MVPCNSPDGRRYDKGSFIMGIAAAAANYFILLPMFEVFMPLDRVIASFGAFIPEICPKQVIEKRS